MAAGQFTEWVRDFVGAINHDIERRQDELLLQIWLHKVQSGQSFAEWKEAALGQSAQHERPKAAEDGSALLARNLEIANRTLNKLKQSERR